MKTQIPRCLRSSGFHKLLTFVFLQVGYRYFNYQKPTFRNTKISSWSEWWGLWPLTGISIILHLINIFYTSINECLKAKKQIAISRAPYVLVIHLKRFAYANMNAKLNKAVRFTTELNFPCTDQNLVDGNNVSMIMIKYQLYAVIVGIWHIQYHHLLLFLRQHQ